MTLEQISSNLFTLIGVPIIIYTKNDTKIHFQDFTIPAQLKNIIEDDRAHIKDNTLDYSVYRLKDFSELSYCSFKVLESTIIIGPYLEREIKSNTINTLSKRLKLIYSEQIETELFFNTLVVLSDEELDFVYHMISNITHSKYNSPVFRNVRPVKATTSRSTTPDDLFIELEYVKHNYKIEDAFTTIIEQGNIDAANAFNTAYIMRQLPKRALHDSLRNTKTKLTILNTLCNRAAIRGGIDVQLGHQISTHFAIAIEAMKTTLDNDQLSQEIIIEYTNAVKNYSLHNYSKLIRKAILEIRQHLTRNYGLNDLAEDLNVSKEHLSRAFKKETSFTVATYIGHAKVIEAKKMLEHSDFSISDISDALGFSNSTYFTKIFKKHIAISPKQYRNLKANIK